MHNKSLSNQIPEVILWFSAIIPVFFSSTFAADSLILPLCLIPVSLFFYILLKTKTNIPKTTLNYILLAAAVLSIAILPFSMLPIRSIPGTLLWIAMLGIFICSQLAINSKELLIKLCSIFTLGAVVLAIRSTYDFMAAGLSAYPRLESPLGLHNAYGGFLLIPLMISVAFSLTVNTNSKKVLWTLASGLLISNIILTFSRGTWVSGVLSILLIGILFRKQIILGLNKTKVYEYLIRLLLIVIASGILAFCFWTVANNVSSQKTANGIPQDVVIFTDKNLKDNAFVARLYYFKDAWDIFLENPLIGSGSGTYADALAHTKTDPGLYSSDPHNFFLKLLSEQGMIITIIFLSFLILLTSILYKKLTEQREIPIIFIAVFTGLGASLLHACMDVEWTYPALLLIPIIFAGSLYGTLTATDIKKTYQTAYTVIFLIILTLSSLISLWIFIADNSRQDGDYHLDNRRYPEALSSYNDAVSINPYEPKSWYGRSQAYIALGSNNKALDDLNQAISLNSTNGQFYSKRATLDAALGNMKTFEQDLLKSIQYHPASDLSDYVALLSLYTKEKKTADTAKLIGYILPIYEKYQKTSWFTDNPSAETIKLNISILKIMSVMIKQ